MKRYDARERREFWKFCNKMPFSRSIFCFRVPEREDITIYCLNGSLLTRIYQYLPLVDQICMALSYKKFLSCYKVLAITILEYVADRLINHTVKVSK